MRKLKTTVCEMFGIEYPLCLAGMGGFISPSGPRLAAAVSNAGGLGVLGGAFVAPDELARWIDQTRELTDRPFGVGTLIPQSVTQGKLNQPPEFAHTKSELPSAHLDFMRQFLRRHQLPEAEFRRLPIFDPAFIREQLSVVLDKKVPVYVSGLGSPEFLIERAHRNGTKVGVVVGAAQQAEKAVLTGVDFVVAQGHDGGGHNSPTGTMTLIPRVADAVAGRVPVLGAGAIMTGRQMVAALVLGAQGVWCGSAFLATDEAQISTEEKELIVRSNESDTVITKALSGKMARVLKGSWASEFEASGLKTLPMTQQLALTDQVAKTAQAARRLDIAPGGAGEGIGFVKKIRPAKEVFDEIIAEAEKVLRELA